MSTQQLITTEPRLEDSRTTDRAIQRPPTARVQLTFCHTDRHHLRNLIDDRNAIVAPKGTTDR